MVETKTVEENSVEKRKRKNDLLLAAVLLALALVSLGAVMLLKRSSKVDGDMVLVYVNGEVKESFPLKEEGFYRIDTPGDGYNIVAVKEGAVRMSDANCPDRLCVHQGEIRTGYEVIVCLPHGLYVEIQTQQSDETDIIVR